MNGTSSLRRVSALLILSASWLLLASGSAMAQIQSSQASTNLSDFFGRPTHHQTDTSWYVPLSRESTLQDFGVNALSKWSLANLAVDFSLSASTQWVDSDPSTDPNLLTSNVDWNLAASVCEQAGAFAVGSAHFVVNGTADGRRSLVRGSGVDFSLSLGNLTAAAPGLAARSGW